MYSDSTWRLASLATEAQRSDAMRCDAMRCDTMGSDVTRRDVMWCDVTWCVACVRARRDTFQNNIQPTHQPAHVSPRTCARFKRFLAPPPCATPRLQLRLPYPLLSTQSTLSLFLYLSISLSLSLSLSLYPLLSTLFLSSNQRRFFRTHTPPRINNSPYEFTRSGWEDRTTGASERANERAGGQATRRREQHAFLLRRPRSRVAPATRKRARSPYHRHTPPVQVMTARGELP